MMNLVVADHKTKKNATAQSSEYVICVQLEYLEVHIFYAPQASIAEIYILECALNLRV